MLIINTCMTIICKHLDFLPEIPEHLTTEFLGDFEAVRDVWYEKARISFSQAIHCTELKNWLEENITKCEIFNLMHIQARGGENTGFVGFHSDGPNRRWALNYVLETGNPTEPVTTSFWQDKTLGSTEAGKYWKGVSLPRKYTDNNPAFSNQGSSKDLELLMRVDKEPFKWYLFNGHVIHSVENIKTVRNMITISFHEDFDIFQIPWWKDVQ